MANQKARTTMIKVCLSALFLLAPLSSGAVLAKTASSLGNLYPRNENDDAPSCSSGGYDNMTSPSIPPYDDVVLASTVDMDAATTVWPVSKPLPEINPSPKTVLFVAHFFVSTDVNHMLLMASELRERGHYCHFIVMEPYVKRVDEAGFTATPTPNVLQGAGLDTIQRAFSYASHETSWFRYIYKYVYGIAPLAAEYYEPSMIIVEDWIAEFGKPDLMICSKASESAIDVAWHEEIPLSVLFTMPLGGMINQYEDVIAAPDANLWGSVKEQAQMWMRFRKMIARVVMLVNPVTARAGLKLAWARYRHNYNPFAIPGDYWKRSIIISPWSLGIDLARPLRPLTHLVGFMTPTPPTLPHDETSLAQFSPEDQEHVEYLNSKSDGVVFCAFGSLAVLTQEWFDELVAGMDLWVRTQGKDSGAVIAVNQISVKAGLNITGAPDTVQVTGWINQKLFLAHPHTQAFVTHGGLGSLGESIQARVPMLVFPLFFDQPNNAHRLEEAGVALKLHFREERVIRSKIASRLNRLTSEPGFVENLNRQYQINQRAGGVSRAVDLLEDVLLLEGDLGHLIPITERASFFQRTNTDLFLFVALCMGLFAKQYLWPMMQRYRVRARVAANIQKTPTSSEISETLVSQEAR